VPNFQLVLLGVCLGVGLTGVDSMNAWFQSCSGKGLDILIVLRGVFAGGTSLPDVIVVRLCGHALTVPIHSAAVLLVQIDSTAN